MVETKEFSSSSNQLFPETISLAMPSGYRWSQSTLINSPKQSKQPDARQNTIPYLSPEDGKIRIPSGFKHNHLNVRRLFLDSPAKR